MLESHTVAALTRSVQHLILIGRYRTHHLIFYTTEICIDNNILGDHQQLRPTTSVYELARKYKMDVSLFERMINNNLHCITLKQQYRMRPEIANLIRPTIYKELFDHESVLSYPDVKGMANNLFFIDHDYPESEVW